MQNVKPTAFKRAVASRVDLLMRDATDGRVNPDKWVKLTNLKKRRQPKAPVV